MTNSEIDDFFRQHLDGFYDHIDREPNGIWQFQACQFPMFIQTQESVNRMRIVAFIAEVSQLDEEFKDAILEANYHTSLDVRYAFTDGHCAAAFIHPLEELTYRQFLLGLYQTISCAETFGTSFSSGTLVFGGPMIGSDGASLDDVPVNVMEEVIEKIQTSD